MSTSACSREQGGNPRTLLDRWIARSPFTRERIGERPAFDDLKGGIIPTGRKRTMGRVLLAGDAGGVADPFTAEGIYQAIHSGRLAARALLENADYDALCAPFDRNERAANGLRATFDAAIELCARRALAKPSFAHWMSTAVFFPKRSLARFGVDLLLAATIFGN